MSKEKPFTLDGPALRLEWKPRWVAATIHDTTVHMTHDEARTMALAVLGWLVDSPEVEDDGDVTIYGVSQ